MKCEIGVAGELTKTFEVASPQVCRVNAAMEITADGKPKANFVTTDAGVVIPDGTGTATKADNAPDGRACASVTLANGKSGNMCSKPSLSR